MNVIDKIYEIGKPLTVAIVIGAAGTVSAYYNPVPITKGWGDLITRDMAARARIAENIKREIGGYAADGRLEPLELLNILALTNPKVLVKHFKTAESGMLFSEAETPTPSIKR